MNIQQEARLFPCRRERGGCGARPGEFCVTWRGKKSYTVHLDRLEQESDAWKQAHVDSEGKVIRDIPQKFLEPER
jgi:hypothetical protein